MKRFAVIVACVVVMVGTVAVVSGLCRRTPAQAALIPSEESATMLGGACDNYTCGTVACKDTTPESCKETLSSECKVSKDPSVCKKRLSSNYAKCIQKAEGRNCTETSQTGCFQDYSGPSDLFGNCDDSSCPNKGSDCGEVKYECKSSFCGS